MALFNHKIKNKSTIANGQILFSNKKYFITLSSRATTLAKKISNFNLLTTNKINDIIHSVNRTSHQKM